MKKNARCNICGGEVKDKLHLKYKDIVGMTEAYTQHVSICPKCGFIFTRNPFDSKQLEDRYKFFSKFEFDDKDCLLAESDDYKIRSQRQNNFIERVIGKEKIQSVLEVGASSGYNLSLYKECDVLGIEPSAINCKNAKRNYGLDMFCGTFENFYKQKQESMKYDLIFLSHVLEHIVNPADFVKKCAEFNNRYFFIEVPTFDYKFIDEPYGMFCEEHVNMFTLESLEALMKKSGYALIDVDMIFCVESSFPAGWPAISTIWEKREKVCTHRVAQSSEMNLENYIAHSKSELLRIKQIIDEIPNNSKLAIWGTGHHASMLLANTNLQDKNIVRIYDSDKKKRGALFAGKSIEPFDENDIKDGKVETILVATYTAQKAIENVLRPYSKEVKIITLYEL